jgi:lysophospholipase L1-like esterase
MKMKKIYLIITLTFLAKQILIGQKNQFEAEITHFEKEDSIQMPIQNSNLFTGSSSIKLWGNLGSNFIGYSVLNRGFGGSKLTDLEIFTERIITKYSPGKIFIYSGENDIDGGATAEQVLDRFIKVFIKIRTSMPNIPIAFISIKPSIARESQFEIQKQANKLIKRYLQTQSNTDFINIVPKMLLKKKPNPSLFIADKLHMNQKGYEIWTKKIRRYLIN